MRRSIVLLTVTSALLAGCGAESAGEETAAAERTVDVSLVTFEAEWQCERERHAFDELEDLAVRFDQTREAAGISVEAYAAFQEELATDTDLRLEVLAAYRAECG